MHAPMPEVAFIAKQQSKFDKALLRQLRTIQKHGTLHKLQNDVIMNVESAAVRRGHEALSFARLIQWGGPSETIRFNHYRLTAEGEQKLAELEAKLA